MSIKLLIFFFQTKQVFHLYFHDFLRVKHEWCNSEKLFTLYSLLIIDNKQLKRESKLWQSKFKVPLNRVKK